MLDVVFRKAKIAVLANKKLSATDQQQLQKVSKLQDKYRKDVNNEADK